MKQHKLLKDLPFAKAGTIFERYPEEPVLIYKNYRIHLLDINADDWFEEIKEPELPKEFFCIDIDKVISYNYYLFQSSESLRQKYIRFMEKYKSVGNYFETKEKAEKIS